MRHLIGIDGGGTRTTLAVADGHGREILRRTGPAGLVDPRRPAETAEMLTSLVREALDAAGISAPVDALWAGLAGVGNRAERETVQRALAASGLATRVAVGSDGEAALQGALEGGAGILLIAGTGSSAYGRGDDGRVERCGGWGVVVGDEGSGFAIGRAALRAALRAADGRGAETRLLPVLLDTLGLSEHDSIPPWAGRAEKAEIAALALYPFRLAEEGDEVARGILRRAASELAAHAAALARRLAPWSAPVPVVLHGGVVREAAYAALLRESLEALDLDLRLREAAADAVTGSVQFARELAAT